MANTAETIMKTKDKAEATEVLILLENMNQEEKSEMLKYMKAFKDGVNFAKATLQIA